MRTSKRERDVDITDTHREVKRREFLIIILGIKGSCLKLLVELVKLHTQFLH
jgi:hypothetical protein